MDLTAEQKERFWAKVNKTDSCWLWTGSCDSSEHGQCRINNKLYRVHRISWLLAGNIIPEGLEVCHECKFKNCVNPAHLRTDTHANNMRDRIRDETSNRGIKHPSNKLTEIQVKEIRNSDKTQRELATIYNVGQRTISDIKNHKIWSWLSD